jgi:hypothetical protein
MKRTKAEIVIWKKIVVPANAGIQLDLALPSTSKSNSKMDPGVRRDDDP